MKQQTLDHGRRGGGKKRNKKYWMCQLKVLHHVCLILFCIIDMILAKCFLKQLNNLLMSMLPQRVPDLDKKLNPHSPIVFFSLGLAGLLALRPLYEETCQCYGPRRRRRRNKSSVQSQKNIYIYIYKKWNKSIRTCFTGVHVDGPTSRNVITRGSKKFIVQLKMFVCLMWNSLKE